MGQALYRGAQGFAANASATLNVTFPATLQPGDLMFAWCGSNGTSAYTWSASGFTAVTAAFTGGDATCQLLWKTATSSDVLNSRNGTAYTVTMSSAQNWTAVAGAYAASGITPFDPVPSSSGTPGLGTTITGAGVTTTQPGDVLVWFGLYGSSVTTSDTITPPSGFATEVPQFATSGAGVNVVALMADMTQAAPGATGAQNGTVGASHGNAGLLIALRPGLYTAPYTWQYTDLYADVYSSLYGQLLGTPWPQAGPLELEVDLLLNGTWTDITSYCYQRDGSVNISVTSGQPDESSKLVTAKCTLQLNNRGGTFTGKNASSPFYPYITRNTQIRVLVPANYNSTDAGMAYAFSGEVSSWPKSRDTSGNDVWCDITASGISRRLNQAGSIGSVLKRFYLQKDASDPLRPIAYWPCEDGSTATTLAEVTGNGSAATFTGSPTLASDDSFGGSDPLPALNGSAWTALTGVFGDPGSATFTAPGTHTFTPRAGLTSLSSVECWGGGGGGTNGYQANNGKDAGGGGGEYAKGTSVAVTAQNAYPVTVGAGGAGGALTSGAGLKQKQGSDGGSSVFPGDAVTVTAHGGKGGTFTGSRAGAGGTGSTNATHHDGGAGGKNSGALFGGSGGGGSGGSAANGNAGSNGGGSNTGAAGGVAVTGGGAGGKGGNGGAHVDQGGTTGAVPGGGGGSGGENSSNSAAHSGGNGGAGKVKLTWTPLVSPAYNVVRFLLHIPSGGDTNSSVVAQFKTSGKVATCILTYTTASSGTLTMTGKDSGGGLLFTSTPFTGVNGGLLMISMELGPGATVGYALRAVDAYNIATFGTSGTASASGSIGAVSEVDVNPAGALTGTAIGHVLVQYSYEDVFNLSGDVIAGPSPITGWDGELWGDRFQRLGAEEGISCQLAGNVSDTPAMGPQPSGKLIDVLQQGPDLDGGLLYEPASQFGLAYRTLASMTGQHPAVIADYSLGQLSAPFAPTEDDQLLRNIVTAQRVNGSSVTVRDTGSAASSLDPPDGVGQYPVTVTVNAHADSQLAGVASRVLALGTVDDDRYPAVNFQLSRSAAAELYAQLVAMIPGDYLRIINGPADLTSSDINQLAFGFAWTLAGFQFDVQLNCVPESPFES